MERKTYYMILGVSRTESASGIRTAYRDLAKRLHPDVAGEQATRAFQELTEAYDVLSDPQRRFEYNHKLGQAEGGKSVPARQGPPEAKLRDPVVILEDPERIRPSFEAMYDRFLRNFIDIEAPKSEGLDSLNVEVLLTREEASRGCLVPVGVPVFSLCPHCSGSGRVCLFPCTFCQQEGVVETGRTVQVPVPPMVRPGSILEMPLQGLGIHNFYLRLHVHVEA